MKFCVRKKANPISEAVENTALGLSLDPGAVMRHFMVLGSWVATKCCHSLSQLPPGTELSLEDVSLNGRKVSGTVVSPDKSFVLYFAV
jgi:hypothetical protein